MNSDRVQTRGRLIYIEPNEFAAQAGAKFGEGVKADNIMWNPEDLNMTVDLQVVVPRRDDCGDNTEFDVNINTVGSTFMHNFVSLFGGTKIGDSELKSSDKMLTDSYTDISYNEIKSGGRSDKECLGISSIDIRFDSHFYPVVNMKFTDIRGYSLFMPAEQQYVDELSKKYAYKNFFQAVFHFPYPRFLLTIKGFYGNKVTFILAVNEFKSSLNHSTGNIDVDISFIGYMYGLYTEIPMTMVMCAPYIDMEDGDSVSMDNVDSVYGKYWADKRNTTFRTMDGSAPLPTMLEYLVKYAQVSDNLDYSNLNSISDIADNQQEKSKLEDIKMWLEKLNSFVEEDKIDCVTKDGKWYDENNKFTLLQLDDNRLISFFNSTYDKYYVNVKDNTGTIDDLTLKMVLENLYYNIKEYNESDYRSSNELFFPFSYDAEGITFYSFYYVDKDDKVLQYDESRNVSDKKDMNKNPYKTLSPKTAIAYFPQVDEKVFTDIVEGKHTNAEGEYNDRKCCRAFAVLSHKELYNIVNDRIVGISGQEKTLTEEATDEISEMFTNALGFKLNLENVYRMIFAHIDCFMHEFNEMSLQEIKSKKNDGRRTFNDLGLKYDARQTDVKAKSNNCFVPPYFALYNDKRQIEYPGNTNIGNIAEMRNIDEVLFVEKIDRAAKMCGKIYAEVDELVQTMMNERNEVEGEDTTTNLSWSYSCFTDFLFGTKNPYSVLDYSNPNVKITDILYIYYMRLLNRSAICGGTGIDFKTFTDNEINSMKNALPQNMSNSMYNELLEYKKANDIDSLLDIFNKKTNNFKGRYCKKELLRKNMKAVGLDEIPVYFSDNPLYEDSNDNFQNLANKGCYIIIRNFNSYKTQLTKNFSREIERRYMAYSDFEYKKRLPIYVKPKENELGKYTSPCSEDKLLDISNNYQETKSDNKDYWYTLRQTGDNNSKYGDNFNIWIFNGRIKELFNSDNQVIKDTGLKADGYDIWDNFNGVDITNYQLTLACYVIASMFPLHKDEYDFFDNISTSNANRLLFGAIPKCVALMIGSLIYRWRKMRQFGNKDVIYYRNTTNPISCINDNNGYIHCSSNYICDVEENSIIRCLKGFVNDDYFNESKWYVTNHKYTTFESLFCEWVSNEFLPIYERFLQSPRLAKKNNIDVECGFRETTYSNGKEHMTINSESRLNEFMCNLATEQIDIFEVSGAMYENNMTHNMTTIISRLSTDYGSAHEDSVTATIRESDEANKEIKKAMYYSLKNLYDKWICSYGSLDKFTLNSPEEDQINQRRRFKEGKYEANACREYNNFIYVDSFYNYIGNDFMVNPMELYELIQRYSNGERNNSVYEFMAEVAEKNKLLMIALPVYTNFYNKDEMVDIFTPHDIYNANSRQTDGFNNTYVIMYTHEASKHLDDMSDEEIGYEGDGYDLADSLGKIGQVASELYNERTGDVYNLNANAFGVTYGMQNQSYFTDISVNMDNPVVTDYSIANQLQLSQTAAHGDIYYPFGIGQNIYSIYSNRSYECTVTMLGCANIMPMMYFQLNNVPMFKGAYMIISVSHHITAGQMMTTFTGIRQSKYLIPFNQVIFDLTGIVERTRSNSGSSGGMKKTNRVGRRDSSGNLILTPSSRLEKNLKETNEKYGGKCFPDGIIPTTKEEMDKLIEPVEVKIWKSQTQSGTTKIYVNRGIKDKVKTIFDKIFEARINNMKIEINIIGGYSWRRVNNDSGTDSPSIHSYGLALDINDTVNPHFRTPEAPSNDNKDTTTKWRTWNHPLVKIMEEEGFGWGHFSARFDSMHFGAVISRKDENGHSICE